MSGRAAALTAPRRASSAPPAPAALPPTRTSTATPGLDYIAARHAEALSVACEQLAWWEQNGMSLTGAWSLLRNGAAAPYGLTRDMTIAALAERWLVLAAHRRPAPSPGLEPQLDLFHREDRRA